MRRLRLPSPTTCPFDFNCGFVGYFGYELKADCEGDAAHRSPMPDAAFVFADRLIAFDHLEQRTYVLCVTEPAATEEAERWLDETSRRLGVAAAAAPRRPGRGRRAPARRSSFRLSRSHEQYLDDIAALQADLTDGETYEVCLTNKITADVARRPAARSTARCAASTRRRSPPSCASASAAVLSSSPERFLSVGRDRWVEAKPIKGTLPRAARPPPRTLRLAERAAHATRRPAPRT